MRLLATLAAAAAALAVAAVAPPASATNHTAWIHGRNGGVPAGWSYWVNGSGKNIAQGVGANAFAVDYDGSAHISVSNPTVVAALDATCPATCLAPLADGGANPANYPNCTTVSPAPNSCYIVAHSAGAAQIGYAEWLYPNRWSIIWTATGGSAAGGSELAGNVAYFFTGYNIDLDLPVSTMRGMYGHDSLGDNTGGYVYNFLGGDYASLTTCIFPGGCAFGDGTNDSAVAFHSSGHYRNVVTTESDRSTGTKNNGTWWDSSYAEFVDGSDGSYGHCIDGSYPCEEGKAGGIMGKVASFVSSTAK